ncbi:hypothetical protein [Demequina aurantiaca]|uniref:hypothetical protein n=1 Tax=Demequina aurantiaca TaxID=676200 RepID=UPI000784E4A9|nr:hypothetical protein [Demequina aurantiaca]
MDDGDGDVVADGVAEGVADGARVLETDGDGEAGAPCRLEMAEVAQTPAPIAAMATIATVAGIPQERAINSLHSVSHRTHAGEAVTPTL